MTLDSISEELAKEGYFDLKEMPDGKVCGLMGGLFTVGLFVGLDRTGYERRYCYEWRAEAAKALREWDGKGDPPGPWIKEKPSDRLGPGATK